MDRKEIINALEAIRKVCTGKCEECQLGTKDGRYRRQNDE